MVLYINACVRYDSRTAELASYLIDKLGKPVTEVRPHEIVFPIVDEGFINRRNEMIWNRDFDDPQCLLAKQFAEADTIIIAAPFWDLSFPAALKQYFEQINILGVTFIYNEEGFPQGLCKADKIYYVTTAGGPIYSDSFGFGYVKALAQSFYQIPEAICIKAEKLDIIGADVKAIMDEAKRNIDGLF